MVLVEPSRGLVELYFRAEVLNRAIDELEQRDAGVVRLDAGSWTRETALMALADALDFPEHYGRNLDALSDCMFDVVSGETGFGGTEGTRVLAIYQFDSLARNDPAFAHELVEILFENAIMGLKLGRPFLALLQSDDPELTLPSVGAVHIGWNRAEFGRSARS
ncbi:MAG: barstar family protein [Acidimicrobiales bacterium]